MKDMKMPSMEEKKAKKDYDGDGKIESGTDEYMGSRDKAIKEAMGKEESADNAEETAEHDEDPCWKDYKMVGMKDKGGKKVPNCVPKGSAGECKDYSEINIPDGWSVSENVYNS